MQSKLEIMGEPQPGMPWEERPAGCRSVVWRYSMNPIIGRDALSTSNSIFNSAVVPFRKGEYNYAGVFRCDDTNRRMRLHVGFSVDGLKWDIDEEDIRLTGADPEVGGVGLRLRPARGEDRRPLLRDVVQRLPRPDDRRGVDRRFRHVPPAGKRLPAL